MTTYYQEQNRENHSRSRRSDNLSVITPENFKLGSMGGYLTLEEMTEELIQMHHQFPDLITRPEPIDDFKTHENRSILQRSEEHTSELQSRGHLVCRLLLEKKKTDIKCL